MVHEVRRLTPPFGMYTALSAQLSGSLRHTHSRLAEFAEEVAFMGGEQTEKMLVERDYATVVKHENQVLSRRWWFGCIEEGIIKWLWGSFGVCMFCLLHPNN
jgi:ATP-binding cassette subfamily D (ALD) long-chain fatty acid import protein